MPIQVACQCGQRFSAKDELAGKRAKCPKCGQPLVIAEAAPAASNTLEDSLGGLGGLMDQAGFENAGGSPCPKCNAGMPPGAVLCVVCGFHLESGEKLETKVIKRSAVIDDGSTEILKGVKLKSRGHEVLDKAQRDVKREELLQASVRKTAPVWLVLMWLIVVVVFICTVMFGGSSENKLMAGQAWQVVAAVLVGLAYLGVVIQAFFVRQSVGWLTVFSAGLFFLFGKYASKSFYARMLVLLAIFCFLGGGLLVLVNSGDDDPLKNVFAPSTSSWRLAHVTERALTPSAVSNLIGPFTPVLSGDYGADSARNWRAASTSRQSFV
ncbi:MAG: hypothetical protein VX346_12945 [Planctomycetota bacterium]|nr:hypothetical protein [Planctomycetota bacterium]